VASQRLLVAALVTLGVVAAFFSAAPSLPLHWLFGLAFGWVLQRAGFCFVSAARDPVLTDSTGMARGLLAAIAVATVGFAVITLTTGKIGTVAPAGLNTVVGGLIFGIGIRLGSGPRPPSGRARALVVGRRTTREKKVRPPERR